MSKITWHKSAVRDVRPFFGAASLERILECADMRLFEDAEFTPEPAHVVEPQHLRKLALSVRPNFDVDSIDGGSLQLDELVLAVTVVQPFLKKTCVVAAVPLSDGLPKEIEIGDEVLNQIGGGGTANIDIALCLSKELPKKPGSPFLLGHWLAKKTFTLRPPKVAEEFDVEPMDDEGWKRMGLPAKTLYHVQYFGGMNEPATKDRQMAKVHVHIDAYNKLAVESNQRIARPALSMLAAEISCQLLEQSATEWENDDEATPNSPLAAFLKRLSQVQACDLAKLKAWVKEPGTPALRAALHADQNTVRTIAES
jgi:hypothetical protein